MRKEEARGAAVPADRVVEDRGVEDGDALHLEDRVSRHHLVVHVDAGARRGEPPAGVGLRAGGELAALHPVGVVVHSLDASPLDEDAGLHVAHRVLEEPAPVLVHLDAVAGEPLLPPDEDDVALRHQAALHAAVGLLVLEDVGLVRLDAHRAEPHVHEPPGLEAALRRLLVRLGPHAQLAGGEGRLLAGRRGLLRGRGAASRAGALGERGGGRQEQSGQGDERERPRQGCLPGASPPRGPPCPSRGSRRPRG